jgi:2-keto-4-pentenoate hydratase
MSEGIIYLINHVSAETLTTGQMILSGTKSPPVEVSTPVIVTLTTGQMVLSGTNSPPVEVSTPVIVILCRYLTFI